MFAYWLGDTVTFQTLYVPCHKSYGECTFIDPLHQYECCIDQSDFQHLHVAAHYVVEIRSPTLQMSRC